MEAGSAAGEVGSPEIYPVDGLVALWLLAVAVHVALWIGR